MVAALSAVATVAVTVTASPGHATELARAARRDALPLLVVVGGDGTVNEAVNGLLADGARDDPLVRTALGIVPAGGMNVTARSLGAGRTVPDAVRRLTEAVRGKRRRILNVGRAGERYFLFASGVGFGADLMTRVSHARRHGRKTTPLRCVLEGARAFPGGTQRGRTDLTVTAGRRKERAFALLVANASPTRTWARGR
ncbi:diacylglycerol/lipid kinase family protein [Streptomyces stramineus]